MHFLIRIFFCKEKGNGKRTAVSAVRFEREQKNWNWFLILFYARLFCFCFDQTNNFLFLSTSLIIIFHCKQNRWYEKIKWFSFCNIFNVLSCDDADVCEIFFFRSYFSLILMNFSIFALTMLSHILPLPWFCCLLVVACLFAAKVSFVHHFNKSSYHWFLEDFLLHSIRNASITIEEIHLQDVPTYIDSTYFSLLFYSNAKLKNLWSVVFVMDLGFQLCLTDQKSEKSMWGKKTQNKRKRLMR